MPALDMAYLYDGDNPTITGVAMDLRNMFAFRRPRLAFAAVILTAFVLFVCLMPGVHMDRFAFGVASGFGLYLLTVGGKAIRNQFGNLAVLMFTCGLAMVSIGLATTPATVYAANGLEALTEPLIGAGAGMFTSVEEEG